MLRRLGARLLRGAAAAAQPAAAAAGMHFPIATGAGPAPAARRFATAPAKGGAGSGKKDKADKGGDGGDAGDKGDKGGKAKAAPKGPPAAKPAKSPPAAAAAPPPAAAAAMDSTADAVSDPAGDAEGALDERDFLDLDLDADAPLFRGVTGRTATESDSDSDPDSDPDSDDDDDDVGNRLEDLTGEASQVRAATEGSPAAVAAAARGDPMVVLPPDTDDVTLYLYARVMDAEARAGRQLTAESRHAVVAAWKAELESVDSESESSPESVTPPEDDKSDRAWFESLTPPERVLLAARDFETVLTGLTSSVDYEAVINAHAANRKSRRPAADAFEGPPEPGAHMAPWGYDISKLTPSDEGTFYTLGGPDLHRCLPPESMPAALAAEFTASGRPQLLVRSMSLRLIAAAGAAASPGGPPKPLLLEGLSGAGKSVALAQLVHWARACGWLVVYLPSATAVTHDSATYAKSAITSSVTSSVTSAVTSAVTWDTPEAAAALLSGLLAAHGPLLHRLPLRTPGAPSVAPGVATATPTGAVPPPTRATIATVGALAASGVADDGTATDAAVRVLSELAAMTEAPVLIAIDDFNAFWGPSDYHESTGPLRRRNIPPKELRLAAALMDLGAPMARGVRVGATSASLGVSPRLSASTAGAPAVPGGARARLARYDLRECALMLSHYERGHVLGFEPTATDCRYLHALSAGSGRELRRAAESTVMGDGDSHTVDGKYAGDAGYQRGYEPGGKQGAAAGGRR